jgi:HNH endonuclease
MDGKALAVAWKLNVKQARYSEWGNWYAKLTLFPAALLDRNGYLAFSSEAGLRQNGIRVTKQINVPAGISSLPGYVRMVGETPEEIVLDTDGAYQEGSVEKVFLNRYERDLRARKKCIAHYGTVCAACDVDMAVRYGDELKGFIHVHHIVPLAEIGKEYEVDPIADLVPLCPNCHAVAHRFNPALRVGEIRVRFSRGKHR